MPMSSWRELLLERRRGLCFHGSARKISGYLIPNKAIGKQEHECHEAVYASLDPRPALVKALIRTSAVCGAFHWGFEGNEFFVEGEGITFGSVGFVYTLRRDHFAPSGSVCGTELISPQKVPIVHRHVVTVSDIERAQIKLPSS